MSGMDGIHGMDGMGRNGEPRRGSRELATPNPRKRLCRIRGLQNEKPYGLIGAQTQFRPLPGVRHPAAPEGETFYRIQPRRGSRFVAPGWPAGPTGGMPFSKPLNPVGVPRCTQKRLPLVTCHSSLVTRQEASYAT